MRLLWVSHSLWAHSSYSIISGNILKRLPKNWDIRSYGMLNQEEIDLKYDNITIVRRDADLIQYCEKEKIDIVVVLNDVWRREFAQWRLLPTERSFNLIYYAIIDHSPVSPFLVACHTYPDITISISKFVQKELKNNGIESVYIPLGVDSSVYYPIDKAKAKKAIGIKDKFVILWTGRNEFRKGIITMLSAFREFADEKKDVLLHVHTDNLHFRFDLADEAKKNGLNKSNLMISTERFDDKKMQYMYSSADVYVNTSYGGAFELPILESMSCGTPVIAQKFAAMEELIPQKEMLIENGDKFLNLYMAKYLQGVGNVEDVSREYDRWLMDNTMVMEEFLGYLRIPNEEEIAQKLQMIYDNREMAEKIGIENRKFAEKFDWNIICKSYISLLEELKRQRSS